MVLLLWVVVVDNRGGRQLAYFHFYGMLIFYVHQEMRGRWTKTDTCQSFALTLMKEAQAVSECIPAGFWFLCSKNLWLCRRTAVTLERVPWLGVLLEQGNAKQL